MKRIFYVGIVIATCWCFPVYGSDRPYVTIDVHASHTIRLVDQDLFGLNFEWLGMQQLFPQLEDMNGAIKLLRGYHMPLNRMSGTASQLFHWNEAIGPLSRRKPQKLAAWAPKRPVLFGLLEWIDFCQRIDPKAKFVWVINLATETPKDAADLVEFLTGNPSMNPNGGINWAEKRVEYGHPKPVPVAIWELGNEMDWGKRPWSVNRYIKVSRVTIKAMRKVNPNLHFAAHVITAPFDKSRWREGDGIYSWQRDVLKQLGPQLDYVSLHAYYDGAPIAKWNKFTRILQDDIRKITGSNRIKIFDSEYATWPKRQLALGSGHLFKLSMEDSNSLRGCLSTADYFVSMLRSAQTTAACYHAFSSGPWAIIRRDNRTGKYFTTGIFDLRKLLEWAFPPDSRIVQTDTLGNGDGAKAISSDKLDALAALTPHGMNILIINRDPNKAKVLKFNFEKRWIVRDEKVLTADSLNAFDSSRKKYINVITIHHKDDNPLRTMKFAPKSITAIELVSH